MKSHLSIYLIDNSVVSASIDIGFAWMKTVSLEMHKFYIFATVIVSTKDIAVG